MRRTRLALYAAGAALLAYGVVGLFTADRAPSPSLWARFWLGGLVTHDLLLAPLVVAVGVLATRLVRGDARPYVQAGLALSGMVSLVALPFVLGRGRDEREPSALPLDYGRGLFVTLAAIWLAIAAVALLRERRNRRAMRGSDLRGSR